MKTCSIIFENSRDEAVIPPLSKKWLSMASKWKGPLAMIGGAVGGIGEATTVDAHCHSKDRSQSEQHWI